MFEKRPSRLFKLFVIAFLIFSSLTSYAKPHKFQGGFIQLQSWMMDLTKENWNAELVEFKKLGLESLIIQWLKVDTFRFFPIYSRKIDPIETILEFADKNKMKILLGLNFDSDWWTYWDNSVYLHQKTSRATEFSKLIWNKYRHHPSFSGWYIPYELGDEDYDPNEIKSLNLFLRGISSSVKKLSSKKMPVALSVFFSHKLTVSELEKVFTPLLRNSQIDILIVQDGVGARGWKTELDKQVLPYLKAFQNISRKLSIDYWVAVENFTTLPDGSNPPKTRVSTDLHTLKKQMETAAKTTKKIITFDVFHYMSPLRGAQQKQLFTDYLNYLSVPN